jgi:hypothetical protein
MAFVPPARHLQRAKDLADARYFERWEVADLRERRDSRGPTSAASFGGHSAIPRTPTC